MRKLLRDIEIGESFIKDGDVFTRIHDYKAVRFGDQDTVMAIQTQTNEPYVVFDDDNKLQTYEILECDTCSHQAYNCCTLNGMKVPSTGTPEWCNYLQPEEKRIKCCENCTHYGSEEAIERYCLSCRLDENEKPTKWKDVHK